MLIKPSFVADIRAIILQNRHQALPVADHQRILIYWYIGRRIFEEKPQGQDRAEYIEYNIRYLSPQLQPGGNGVPVRQPNWYRKFYQAFPILSALWIQLSRSRYKPLPATAAKDQLPFYAAEALRNNWQVRQLADTQ